MEEKQGSCSHADVMARAMDYADIINMCLMLLATLANEVRALAQSTQSTTAGKPGEPVTAEMR